ncbi:Methylglyoxal reductase [Cupriavidus necator H850]|jgi:2,5-diketo-D-gluconate reductase B|uniref:aldo/keto reductase n=1 Tax=Cupriavidus TaxID=106589 RepID=UPI0035302FB8|nr:Methylglyoxal reductase [Cupriavidus necator H850]
MPPFLQNRKLADFTRAQGIHITAYVPLAYAKVMHDPVLQRIALAHDASPAQVALAWLLQQGCAVIPSSTRRAKLESNCRSSRPRGVGHCQCFASA